MKNLYKKVLCGVLSFVCMIPLSLTASAAEATHFTEAELAIIDSEREKLYDFLEMQLAAQDALEYIDEFSYLVDMTINSRYGISSHASNDGPIDAPNGAFVYGNTAYWTREAEFIPEDVTTAMIATKDEPIDIILAELESAGYDAIWDKIKEDLRISVEIPGMDKVAPLITVTEICMLLNDINMAYQWQQVKGSGCIINELYDKVDLKTIKVIWPWDAEPELDLSIFPDDEKLTYTLKE